MNSSLASWCRRITNFGNGHWCGSLTAASVSNVGGAFSGAPHASDRGDVTMRLAADIVFEPNVIAKLVDEARLPVARVVIRIVHVDDDLELRRADPADPLGGHELVGMRRAGRIEEGLFIE